jgi:putative ABC transport system permease protein
MGIPLRRGRLFDERDRAGSVEIVIVNETLARRLWPSADPIGQTLLVPDGMTPAPREVVGVVGDTRHHDLGKDPEPEIYRPAYQAYWPFYGLVVRTGAAPDIFARSLRDVASRVDSTVPITAVQAFDDLAESTWAWRRSSMALLSIFAGSALLLAFVGVYGVMAYSVSERAREIGLRLALGARPADVARGVLRQTAVVAGIGVAVGLAGSALLAGLLGALLFGVGPIDPSTFAIVTLVMLAASLVASALPAAIAARTDPTIALRAE